MTIEIQTLSPDRHLLLSGKRAIAGVTFYITSLVERQAGVGFVPFAVPTRSELREMRRLFDQLDCALFCNVLATEPRHRAFAQFFGFSTCAREGDILIMTRDK